MNSVEISIIVPVYKSPEQLHTCIKSIQKQTFSNLEIILIDDGSPDDCGRICDEYAHTDQRIKVIHKTNGGLSAARNSGFLAASGKWIMFVDGDDWIESDMCEVMYKKGERLSTDVIICGVYKDFNNSRYKYKINLEENKIYSGEECLWLQEQILVYNSYIAFAYAKLIRRDVLLNNNILHDEVLGQGAEGVEFNFRLFGVITSAAFIDIPYYHYTYNENSVTSSFDERNTEYVVRAFEKIQKLLIESPRCDQLMPWFYNRFAYAVIATAVSGYFNPCNEQSYKQKKESFINYLAKPIVQECLANVSTEGMPINYRLVLWLIKNKMIEVLYLLGTARRWQKGHL